ncbi:recombinase family protein [Rhodococcus sp. JT-3]|uniref:recombinase family protein n=1 Tax=Rhodococcus sp. JT-3 TaxID=1973213 RepID=UPI001E40F0DD|nr:recombinase family protein [Rhodococcus sp. JT-3]
MLIGYARCASCGDDEPGERDQLVKLGVEPGQIHVDHGLSGIDRPRQELTETLGAVSVRDTLVVTVLDRLARSRDVSRNSLRSSKRRCSTCTNGMHLPIQS